jgi:hypothetical protein
MMPVTWPEIRIHVGDVVTFDGEIYEVKDRDENDELLVESNQTWQTEAKHIDWFEQKADEADVVTIVSK